MFVSAWNHVDTEKQTLATLEERILVEEQRISSREEGAVALYVGGKSAKGDKRRVQQKPHGNSGETKRNFPEKKRDKPTCYRCDEVDHIARKCPKRKQSHWKGGGGKEDHVLLVVEFRAMPALTSGAHRLNTADIWLTDSGASRHATYRRDWLKDFRTMDEEIVLGDDSKCRVEGTGQVEILRLVDGTWQPGTIEDVWYVPHMGRNLLSVGYCDEKGLDVSFANKRVFFKKNDKIIAEGVKLNNCTYKMLFKTLSVNERPMEANAAVTMDRLWHERLAHVNTGKIAKMVSKGLVTGVGAIKDTTGFSCVGCCKGKTHRNTYPEVIDRRKYDTGRLFHSDLCGTMQVEAIDGSRYFMTLIENL